MNESINRLLAFLNETFGQNKIGANDPRFGALPPGSPQANALENMSEEERALLLRQQQAQQKQGRATDLLGGFRDLLGLSALQDAAKR